jgi:hypothetical protein
VVAISTIIGHIVHNLRSARDSPASEMAVRHVGRLLKDRPPGRIPAGP